MLIQNDEATLLLHWHNIGATLENFILCGITWLLVQHWKQWYITTFRKHSGNVVITLWQHGKIMSFSMMPQHCFEKNIEWFWKRKNWNSKTVLECVLRWTVYIQTELSGFSLMRMNFQESSFSPKFTQHCMNVEFSQSSRLGTSVHSTFTQHFPNIVVWSCFNIGHQHWPSIATALWKSYHNIAILVEIQEWYNSPTLSLDIHTMLLEQFHLVSMIIHPLIIIILKWHLKCLWISCHLSPPVLGGGGAKNSLPHVHHISHRISHSQYRADGTINSTLLTTNFLLINHC